MTRLVLLDLENIPETEDAPMVGRATPQSREHGNTLESLPRTAAPDTDQDAPPVTHEQRNTPTPRRCVRVRSHLPGLEGQVILCVETAADVPSGHTGPFYTRDELTRMQSLNAAAIAAIHETRTAFGGAYTGLTPPDTDGRVYVDPADRDDTGTLDIFAAIGKEGVSKR